MDTALTAREILARRAQTTWLIGAGADEFWPQLAQFQLQMQRSRPRDILLAEPNPVWFLAAWLAACQQPCRLWLANPRWGLQEWTQVAQHCQPDFIVGRIPIDLWNDRPGDTFLKTRRVSPLPYDQPQILIPTGGSSGSVRFAVHTWQTLAAAVAGFQQHFQCHPVNAYCVLPLFHVSGLMQAMRCLLSGGKLILQPFRDLLQDGAIAALPGSFFLSLVPTQLQRLLASERDQVAWLRSFTAILLGGAPPWASLLEAAQRLRLPLAPTYGMTETAAQIATLLPPDFLAGNRSSGQVLPHAQVSICNDAGQPLPTGQTGRIAIAATSLMQGYWQQPCTFPFQSGDLGYLDASGYLYVLGRENTLILTGGEKVFPAEVEAAIAQTGLVEDVAVLGIPDADWGEQVVAVVVTDQAGISDRLKAALKPLLSPPKIPKQWLTRPSLPRTAQGKLNWAELQRWVMDQLQPTVATTEPAPALGDGAGA